MRILGQIFLAFLVLEALWLGSALIGNSLLKTWNPHSSSFQLAFEWSQFRLPQQEWKAIGEISPKLIRAVLVAEDDSFLEHEGLDFKEFRESFKLNWKKKKFVRGGSTITMQLVKNLYLSPYKNPIRKLHEILLAMDLESKLGKKRILEIYLNIVEWGDGIYGAEAASQYYFKISARQLNSSQAAYLAALLPNPQHLTGNGKKRATRRKSMILRRMKRRSLPKDW